MLMVFRDVQGPSRTALLLLSLTAILLLKRAQSGLVTRVAVAFALKWAFAATNETASFAHKSCFCPC